MCHREQLSPKSVLESPSSALPRIVRRSTRRGEEEQSAVPEVQLLEDVEAAVAREELGRKRCRPM
jgi:hypothetical protein